MARIRSIKPEFPQSESMGRVSRDARLTFLQLWTIADDAGRLRGNSRMLASLLFPYDDDAPSLIDGWLAELEREGCVRRYQAEGQSYLEICNWLIHQKIDKPSQSKLPPFVEPSPKPREDSRTLTVGREGKGEEGKGRGREARAKSPAPESFPLPDWIPREPWEAWIASRVKLKKPPTAEALTLAARELDKLRADGHDPGAVLEQSTLNGWSGLFPLKANRPRALPPDRQAVADEARRLVFGGEHAAG